MDLDLAGQGSSAELRLGPGSAPAEILLTLSLSDVPPGSDTKGLFGFGFSLVYDTSAFDSLGASVGNPVLADASLWNPFFVATRGEAGRKGLTANRFSDPPTPVSDPLVGDVTLATIALSFSQPGVYAFSTSDFLPTGGGNLLFDSTDLGSAPGFYGGGSVMVSVPEPSVALLFAVVILAAATARRG